MACWSSSTRPEWAAKGNPRPPGRGGGQVAEAVPAMRPHDVEQGGRPLPFGPGELDRLGLLVGDQGRSPRTQGVAGTVGPVPEEVGELVGAVVHAAVVPDVHGVPDVEVDGVDGGGEVGRPAAHHLQADGLVGDPKGPEVGQGTELAHVRPPRRAVEAEQRRTVLAAHHRAGQPVVGSLGAAPLRHDGLQSRTPEPWYGRGRKGRRRRLSGAVQRPPSRSAPGNAASRAAASRASSPGGGSG